MAALLLARPPFEEIARGQESDPKKSFLQILLRA